MNITDSIITLNEENTIKELLDALQLDITSLYELRNN